MARTPQDKEKMSEFLTRTRCTPRMKARVDTIAIKLGVSSGDVIRGCVAHMTGMEGDINLMQRVLTAAASWEEKDAYT